MMSRKTLLLAAIILALACAPAMGERSIVIPDLSIKPFDIPDNMAMEYVRGMGFGWNLGNAMDATANGNFHGDDLDLEGWWCRVKTTKGVFEALRDKGFSTVRIPVSWHDHVSGDGYIINEAWMDRVQQLVDWALECDLRVILNTHHDNEAAFCYPDEAHMDNSLSYMTNLWRQIAERFRNYDDRLIFESMNEPRLAGTEYEWWFNPGSETCREAAECVNRLNQAFVDTVRVAGGWNTLRYLMVPGYDASLAGADPAFFRLPEDRANRLIVSVHAYIPYSFALDTQGISSFSLRNPSQTGEIDELMNRLYERYISQGVPVVIGEFGALNKNNLQDRVDLTAYYVASASARGIPCVWWDNNIIDGNGERFGLLNRATLEWSFPEIVETAMKYALR